MKTLQLAVSLVFVLSAFGCSQEVESPADSAKTENSAVIPEPEGVVENVEEFTDESADLIEGNVDSIEANAEKGVESSTVSNEQFDTAPEVTELGETSNPPAPTVDVIEDAEVEVDTDSGEK